MPRPTKTQHDSVMRNHAPPPPPLFGGKLDDASNQYITKHVMKGDADAVKKKRTKADKEFDKKVNREAAYWEFHPKPADRIETAFRHSGWQLKREKVRAALASIYGNSIAMERFDECGGDCAILYSPSEKRHRVAANYCHCRHCEPCMRAKANRLAANLKARLAEKPKGQYRFITLTLRHKDIPLAAQVKRLYAAFKKMRNMKVWKKSQRGGAFMLEVKWKESTRRWHPHLHIIGEGDFIRQDVLSAAWHHATGDSQIVDVRKLDSSKDAAHYVSKYVTKGTSSEVWNDTDAAQEWITATKGLRICATYGSWRGYRLTAFGKDPGDWKWIGTLCSIVAKASAGETWATMLLGSLKRDGDHVRHDESPANYAPGS